MAIVSSTDFDNVASEIGEAITIYSPSSVTYASDYDSVATSTLGSGTAETAIVQLHEGGELDKREGRQEFGDLFLMCKSGSVIADDSLVKIDSTSKIYSVIYLESIRVSGSVHHFEARLRYVRDA